MPRQRRIEYKGAIYHVMSRGDRREDIVQDDADRELWIKTLGEASAKCGWQVHAYCLMSNHFNLVVETKSDSRRLVKRGANAEGICLEQLSRVFANVTRPSLRVC